MSMKCEKCSQTAVFEQPTLCKDHFITYVEETVAKTISEQKLCTKENSVCVAVSGGKDSVSLLVILKKLGFKVTGLAVDEGIEGYRDTALDDLSRIAQKYDVKIRVVSFKEEFGKPLDDVVEGRYPCSICGVFRRYILNKYAKEYDVIATGHNLDDEAQGVLMNLTKANVDLLKRTHIRSPEQKGFVPRIKPFAYLTEKEILAYALLNSFDLHYVECPHMYQSLRDQLRDVLNDYTLQHPGTKEQLLEAGMLWSKKEVTAEQQEGHSTDLLVPSYAQPCPSCGEPSAKEGLCRACVLKKEIAEE